MKIQYKVKEVRNGIAKIEGVEAYVDDDTLKPGDEVDFGIVFNGGDPRYDLMHMQFIDAPAKFIGYQDDDKPFGADGWWGEGQTIKDVLEDANDAAKEMQLADEPELIFVSLAKLSELSHEEWVRLYNQWKLARINAWTSNAVDKDLKAEYSRRQIQH